MANLSSPYPKEKLILNIPADVFHPYQKKELILNILTDFPALNRRKSLF